MRLRSLSEPFQAETFLAALLFAALLPRAVGAPTSAREDHGMMATSDEVLKHLKLISSITDSLRDIADHLEEHRLSAADRYHYVGLVRGFTSLLNKEVAAITDNLKELRLLPK